MISMKKFTKYKAVFALLLAFAIFFVSTDVASAASVSTNACPTYDEAYERLIAFKEKYPEGMLWNSHTPYGSNTSLGYYRWHGGLINGVNLVTDGCVAFAFELSDGTFGSLPARTFTKGQFKFEDVKVGDILRFNGYAHTAIVLQVGTGGVTIAEANYNNSVHWGRALSRAFVENSDMLITRYPANFIPPDIEDGDAVVQRDQEGNLQWTLTKAGILTISGNGAIPNYSPNDGIIPSWNAYIDVVNTINIEDGVTAIGDYAFYQSKALSAYLPDGITSIGQSAFRNSSLVGITIPSSVTSIGNDAFSDCSNLTSVSTSEGLLTIGERAFRRCTSLQYIDFPASITSVGAGAFMSCTNMVSVRFAPGTTSVTLGDSLFSECIYLSNVTLPSNANRISAGMFQSCSSLPTLYIPSTVKEIGENPFTACNFLRTISFGGSEADWNSMVMPALKYSLQSTHTTVLFDVAFDNPFATEPDDSNGALPEEPESPSKPEEPGETEKPETPSEPGKPGNTEESGRPGDNNSGDNSTPETPETPVTPDEPDKPSQNPGGFGDNPLPPDSETEIPVEPDPPILPPPGNIDDWAPEIIPIPIEHEHQWATTWSHDGVYHWHECLATDCTVAKIFENFGYGEHKYGPWVVDSKATIQRPGSKHRSCMVCGYRQNGKIAAPNFDKKFQQQFDKAFKKSFNKQFNKGFSKSFQNCFKKNFDKAFKKSFEKEYRKKAKSKSFSKQKFERSFKTSFRKSFKKSFRQTFERSYRKSFEKSFKKSLKSSLKQSLKKQLQLDGVQVTQKDFDQRFNRSFDKAYQKAFGKQFKRSFKQSKFEKLFKGSFEKSFKKSFKKYYNKKR